MGHMGPEYKSAWWKCDLSLSYDRPSLNNNGFVRWESTPGCAMISCVLSDKWYELTSIVHVMKVRWNSTYSDKCSSGRDQRCQWTHSCIADTFVESNSYPIPRPSRLKSTSYSPKHMLMWRVLWRVVFSSYTWTQTTWTDRIVSHTVSGISVVLQLTSTLLSWVTFERSLTYRLDDCARCVEARATLATSLVGILHSARKWFYDLQRRIGFPVSLKHQ